MEVQYNIDVVDDYTGEVYREGASESAAREYINSHDGLMVMIGETKEAITSSSKDDAIVIRTFWVQTTDENVEQKKREATREFWGY